jgi:pyrethroid hydrolase
MDKKSEFEFKYINIKWSDRYSISSINESASLIPINYIDNSNIQINAITYSNINGKIPAQIAFCTLNSNIHTPYFETNSLEKIKLIPVKDHETGKTWWIEDGIWNKEYKYKDSPICRHVGDVTLYINNYKCIINITSSSFDENGLLSYLEDFKNDLWYLILNENSYIQANAKKQNVKIISRELVDGISQFIEFVNGVISLPKKELREIQTLKDYRKVKPVPRTFMELSIKGHSKMLTSRAYLDSYNIPENQYIHHIVARIHILLKNLTKASNYACQILEQKTKQNKTRLSNYSEYKTINEDVLIETISDLNILAKKEREDVVNAISKQNNSFEINEDEKQIITVKLRGEKQYNNELQFSGDALLPNRKWYQFKKGDFYSFQFNYDIFKDVLKNGYEYKITACIERSSRTWSKGSSSGTIHKRNFYYIYDIQNTTINKKLSEHIESKAFYEKNEWKRKLTGKELKEQNYEKLALIKTIDTLDGQQQQYTDLSKDLRPFLSKIKIIIKKLNKLKIQKNNSFPNSMVFIQNPNYQGSHKLYKDVMNLVGLDEEIFTGLQEVEKIGVVDIPLIYERWCLLQIIKILIEKYRFDPERNWKQKLIDQILNIGRNITLKFNSHALERKITFYYEKELTKNGRRPDFIIDAQSSNNSNESKIKRLVMDAKFYEKINTSHFGGISTIIDKLYNEKNYSESKENTVFILHPSTKSVPSIKTPQTWSKDTYYGESKMFNWDDENLPNHQYGAVLLSPIKNIENGTDDLQRLIGMFLQYGLEDNGHSSLLNDQGKINPITQNKPFCIACGGGSFTWSTREQYSGDEHTSTCNDCHHVTIYNYCYDCKNRLIKNGDYWSYHAMHALQPTNIKCPSCGYLF